MEQVQVAERPVGADAHQMDVRYLSGESYEVSVGGLDTAPTPTELFVASLATCVAFYAGRYLTRHGYGRDGLAVSADFDMASDRPARVSGVRLTVRAPAELPADRRPALHAVVSPCTVHNSLTSPPSVAIELI